MIDQGLARVSLRIDLIGQEAERFLELKQMLGLHSNAELVRFCVTLTFARLKFLQTARADETKGEES